MDELTDDERKALAWLLDRWETYLGPMVMNDMAYEYKRDARSGLMKLILQQSKPTEVKRHRPDCAMNHGGAECDMGPECGTEWSPPLERPLGMRRPAPDPRDTMLELGGKIKTALAAARTDIRPSKGCERDTDNDGNCPLHPDGCPHEDEPMYGGHIDKPGAPR